MSAFERRAGRGRVVGEEVFEVVVENWRGSGTRVQWLRGDLAAMWVDRRVVLIVSVEFDLRAEACGGLAHGDGCFAHAVEGVSAGFRWWAFFDQICENRCTGQNGVVDSLDCLEL